MALKGSSLFLYGHTVTDLNCFLEFVSVSGDPAKVAVLTLGYYSLTSLMTEVSRAMGVADNLNIYTVTADRSVMSNTQNRVTIATSGLFLSIPFSSGAKALLNCGPLLGFAATDLAGATSYTGTSTSGTALVTDPDFPAYGYVSPTIYNRNIGVTNVAGSGATESVLFGNSRFWIGRWKYFDAATAFGPWSSMLTWACAKRGIDFTPDVTAPGIVYSGVIETTQEDPNGLAFQVYELLSETLPDVYETGILKFRVIQ